MSDHDEAAIAVHDALAGFLDEGEIAVAWTLTIDVAGTDGKRYLAHRAGGGFDGSEAPTQWAALGMLRASCLDAEDQLLGSTHDVEDDE